MIFASEGLLFGTAGVPKSARAHSTLAGIQHIASMGLDCLEIEFVKGVRMGSDLAKKIGQEASRLNVRLSVHAPYSINLNAPEEGKRLASQERILHSARLAELCGAESVVFHPGYYGTSSPQEAYETIKRGIQELVSILRKDRVSILLRPEVMGKRSQFGRLEDILHLCREIDGILPCVDFSHIHACEGRANSYLGFHRILKKIQKKLGDGALKNMHIHVSGVEYSEKGEMRHRDLQESDFRYDEWILALKNLGVKGMIICESPNLERDALMLKTLFLSK